MIVIFASIAALILFFYLFGEPMWKVFALDYKYFYNPDETFGDYVVTETEFSSEEIEEGGTIWGVQDSCCPTWQGDAIQKRFSEEADKKESTY